MNKDNMNTSTYTFDEDSILDAIDSQLASMDKKTLLQIRKKLKNQQEDTELIDRALLLQAKQEKAAKKEQTSGFFSTLFGLFLGSSDSRKSKKQNDNHFPSWQQEEVKKGNYDAWNFEEEELEEDDYYYEDD